MRDIEALSKLIRGNTALVSIDTYDESRVLSIVAECSVRLGIPFYYWTSAKGLVVCATETRTAESQRLTPSQPSSAAVVLQQISKLPSPSLVVLCDIHHYLEQSADNRRLLKELALSNDASSRTIILAGKFLDLPSDLQHLSTSYSLEFPTETELLDMLREEGAHWMQMQQKQKIKVDTGVLQRLVRNLRGLGFSDARRLVRQIIRDDSELSDNDVAALTRAKFQMLGMEGVVTYEDDLRSFGDVGGLNKLKTWLDDRKQFWHEESDQRDRPRGVLLLGVQGGGKSLAARAIAGSWNLPLLQIQAGALYNKYIGETERNLREALALADAMSPCAVWIDEIEKGFATDDNDGTSKRVLGSLLTWMAENKNAVFLIATANDVTRLPPELMRKGRIDEIFFVDLPSVAAREQIFTIHLRKRDIVVDAFDINALAVATDGFSGAEIEQAVIAASFTAKARASVLNQELLLSELKSTRPLSLVRAEEIAELRAWAANRTVAAD